MTRTPQPSVIVPLVLLIGCVIGLLHAQERRASDEQLIQWLSSPQLRVREAAIAHIKANFQVNDRSEALDRAVASELVRLNKTNVARRLAGRDGNPPIDDFPAEHHANVIELVAQSSRTFALEPLVGALGTGRMAEEGIVRFGEAALPSLIGVARSSTWSHDAYRPGDNAPHVTASALSALRRMIARADHKLSPSSKALVVAVAGERLRGRQDALIVAEACKLAVATADRGLRQRVEELASDRRAITTMGVADAQVTFVQRVAGDALDRVR